MIDRRRLMGSGAALVIAATLPEGAQAQQPEEGSKSRSAGEKQTKLKVGILRMAALTNPWVAEKEGLFKKHGLDVELIQFRNGNEAVSAHRGGSVDIFLAIPGVAMAAAERGFDVLVIAQNETAKAEAPDSGSIQALKTSKIEKLSDLAGKKVGTSGLRSQQTVAAQVAMAKAGVKKKDVTLIEIPLTALGEVLKAGQVDAIITVDPWTTQLRESGLTKVLAYHFVESIPEQPLGAWYASRDFIQRNPQTVQNFAATIRDSIDYMNADPARARRNVAGFTGLDPMLLEAMPLNRWDHRIRLDKWQAVADMLHENGDLTKSHEARSFLSEQAQNYIVK